MPLQTHSILLLMLMLMQQYNDEPTYSSPQVQKVMVLPEAYTTRLTYKADMQGRQDNFSNTVKHGGDSSHAAVDRESLPRILGNSVNVGKETSFSSNGLQNT